MTPGPSAGAAASGGAGAPAGDAPRDRTRARGWILQVLYRWESDARGGRDRPLVDVLEETLATRTVARRRQAYIRRVVEAIGTDLAGIDRELEESLDHWRMDRLSSVDRSVLRLAAAEMLHLEDVPPRVSIQEAVRLAERYGGDESGRFVNGVLDALFRRREP